MFTQPAQPQTKTYHQSNSFVVVTIKKTSWSGSKKIEDIAFENTQTFSVPNSRIQLVPFNDCRWEESAFEKVMFNFNPGNAINISHIIRNRKKPSIFREDVRNHPTFLGGRVLLLVFLLVHRLTAQSSDYTKMIPPRVFSWKSSACTVPSIFEYFSRKYRQWSPSFGQITDWLFRVAIIY